jgi:hypothetical protein
MQLQLDKPHLNLLLFSAVPLLSLLQYPKVIGPAARRKYLFSIRAHTNGINGESIIVESTVKYFEVQLLL